MEVKNASVAVVDEDDSAASRQIIDALLPPLFLRLPRNTVQRYQSGHGGKPVYLRRRYSTKVSARPDKGQHPPTIEIVSDATAMSQAGRGPSYIENIINKEIEPYWADAKQSQ